MEILKLSCVVFLVLLFSLFAGMEEPLAVVKLSPLFALEGGTYYICNSKFLTFTFI